MAPFSIFLGHIIFWFVPSLSKCLDLPLEMVLIILVCDGNKMLLIMLTSVTFE